MEIEKTSSTFRKYVAADRSYRQFFGQWPFPDDRAVGFCSMMRTIYFWGPAIPTLRVLFMCITVAVICAAFYLKATEILIGSAIFFTLYLLGWLLYRAVLVGGSYLAGKGTTFPGTGTMHLLFQWAKASHDKICPLVIFTEEETETCEE